MSSSAASRILRRISIYKAKLAKTLEVRNESVRLTFKKPNVPSKRWRHYHAKYLACLKTGDAYIAIITRLRAQLAALYENSDA